MKDFLFLKKEKIVENKKNKPYKSDMIYKA